MKRVMPVLLAVAAIAAGQKIAGGPFVVRVTPKTATVVWIVESDQALLQAPGGAAKSWPSLRVEKTTMTGLEPNTRYDYGVTGKGAGKGWFKTSPTGAE